MNSRRRLLKAMLGLGSSLLARYVFPVTKSESWRNWAGHLVAYPTSRFSPGSEDELVDWLRSSSGTVRPVGAGHSFTALVPTEGHLVVVDRLSGMVSHDSQNLSAEVYAGSRLSELGQPLDDIGQAMPNLPDIDRQTVAGAIATSTHGTGRELRSMSGYIRGLTLVTPRGEVLELDQDDDRLAAAAVSLGALGVITRVKFQNRASFRLRTRIWVEETLAVLDTFERYCDEWQHFEMFPLLHSDYSLVVAHQETNSPLQEPVVSGDDGAVLQLIEATPVALRGALINGLATQIEPTETVQASWRALTNLRFDRFNEMEYSVPAEVGGDCLREILQAVKDNQVDVVIPLEYRVIEADDSWLSMYNGSRRVSISVHRMFDERYIELFNLVEPIFWKYEGRPHWGKIHSLRDNELRALYPKFDEFIELRNELDPEARMLNPYLGQLFGVD